MSKDIETIEEVLESFREDLHHILLTEKESAQYCW